MRMNEYFNLVGPRLAKSSLIPADNDRSAEVTPTGCRNVENRTIESPESTVYTSRTVIGGSRRKREVHSWN